ncbi:AraC-type DNA-binding protein [Gracilibacillus orientalis]|uniref:AraC-type DNA-binding protein n=1 Tax=Gracilibacillus orientalis TaxID=334253 RepID=A0A1I4NTC2_9BACI|nr:AraC family transcriptional regulator [Gracilibacillus orientalis]SFM18655.1 AraC-type DNA-binding protein [Gracilibacillus orientalis]
MTDYSKHHSYGFRLKGDYQERVAGLHSVGKELRTEHSYIWDGLKRGEEGRVVFQYTLGGQGKIRIGEKIYPLTKGDAFFVQIPSDHCYYLPEDSDRWDFMYITVYGNEALHHFHRITEKYGHILRLPDHANPIKHILRMLEKLETTGINHAYEASGYAYSFLMECLQYLEYEQRQEYHLPVSIAKAISFIEKNYAEDISLNDMVTVSGLSKYHFTRLFSTSVNQTPIQYLTKVRIQHALDLLQYNERSIEEIANEVGYTSSNYFSKVFKKLLNETPSNYRQNKSVMPVDRLFID